jgi:hypothetical protein
MLTIGELQIWKRRARINTSPCQKNWPTFSDYL